MSKCYFCKKDLSNGNLSYFCDNVCKENYYLAKPNKYQKKIKSVKDIQERCKILAAEYRVPNNMIKHEIVNEEAVKVFTGGLF